MSAHTSLRFVWGLIFLVGCLHAPKHVTAPEPWPMTLDVRLSSLDAGQALAFPDDARARLEESCKRRGLKLTEAGDASVEAQVEASTRWYSQLGGRYRWTVETVVRIVRTDDQELLSESMFEVPVFLLYDHEREDAALRQAMPVVERQFGEVLDRWIVSSE